MKEKLRDYWILLCGFIGLAALMLANYFMDDMMPDSLYDLLFWLFTMMVGSNACCLAFGKKWKKTLKYLVRDKILVPSENAPEKGTIRISFAYLFRIKVDGKYFLVKNGRKFGKFQPVGGAYKYTPEEYIYLKQHFSIIGDNRIPVDETSKMDYRLFVPATKLKAFVKRFDSHKAARENIKDVSREFREELINTHIIDVDSVEYRYCGRHYTDLQYSRYFNCYELLLADIYEVVPDNVMLEQLRELMKIPSDDYYFATSDEIKSMGVNYSNNQQQETITDHSFKILEATNYQLSKKNKYNKLYSVKF